MDQSIYNFNAHTSLGSFQHVRAGDTNNHICIGLHKIRSTMLTILLLFALIYYASALAGPRNTLVGTHRLSTRLSSTLVTHYEEISVQTLKGVSLVDITKEVAALVKKSECQEGVVTIMSRHSTVSVMINEMESRLVDDVRQFVLKLAPPEYPYLHNDLDFR